MVPVGFTSQTRETIGLVVSLNVTRMAAGWLTLGARKKPILLSGLLQLSRECNYSVLRAIYTYTHSAITGIPLITYAFLHAT